MRHAAYGAALGWTIGCLYVSARIVRLARRFHSHGIR